MKVVLSPDSFKGTFSAMEVCRNLERGILSVFPECQVDSIPLADGGEGTLEVLLDIFGGRLINVKASDPLDRPIDSSFGLIHGDRKIVAVEMARTSGIILLSHDELDPWNASTYGLGQVIGIALDYQPDEIVMTLGGSATVDCGTGMATALGYRFFDSSGEFIGKRGGQILQDIQNIDSSEADSRIANVKISALCDVTNPLTGERGAARVFAPQKGADSEMVEKLESGMQNMAARFKKCLGCDVDNVPGAGAAGGMGAAVIAFLGGELISGIDYILDLLDYTKRIADADLIITGEGSFDSQSAGGKVISGVEEIARKKDVPMAVICGLNKTEKNEAPGIWKIFSGADLSGDVKIVDRDGLEKLGKVAVQAFMEYRKLI